MKIIALLIGIFWLNALMAQNCYQTNLKSIKKSISKKKYADALTYIDLTVKNCPNIPANNELAALEKICKNKLSIDNITPPTVETKVDTLTMIQNIKANLKAKIKEEEKIIESNFIVIDTVINNKVNDTLNTVILYFEAKYKVNINKQTYLKNSTGFSVYRLDSMNRFKNLQFVKQNACTGLIDYKFTDVKYCNYETLIIAQALKPMGQCVTRFYFDLKKLQFIKF